MYTGESFGPPVWKQKTKAQSNCKVGESKDNETQPSIGLIEPEKDGGFSAYERFSALHIVCRSAQRLCDPVTLFIFPYV